MQANLKSFFCILPNSWLNPSMETEWIGVQGVSLCFEGECIRKKDVLKGEGWRNEGEKDNWRTYTSYSMLMDGGQIMPETEPA